MQKKRMCGGGAKSPTISTLRVVNLLWIIAETLFRNKRFLLDEMTYWPIETLQKLPSFWNNKTHHSLIRGVLIQSFPAGAKNFTKYVFCHVQFSGVIQNIENCCAIRAKFLAPVVQLCIRTPLIKLWEMKACFLNTK